MARQIHIDLTDAADAQVAKMCRQLAVTTPDLFRMAMSRLHTLLTAEPVNVLRCLETGLMYAEGAKASGLNADSDIYEIRTAIEVLKSKPGESHA